MSRPNNIEWVKSVLSPDEVTGKQVLDVGSRDWTTENKDEVLLSPWLLEMGPESVVGIDLLPGPGVDRVLNATDIVKEFGDCSFDLVLCLEVLEHCQDWMAVVSNLKQATRPGGVLIVTTRTPGYPVHGFPQDYWRFTKDQFVQIFSDFDISDVTDDVNDKGIYLKARRPTVWSPRDLSTIKADGVA